MTEYVHVGQHADILHSGLGIGPSERVDKSALHLTKGDEVGHDQHLIDDGVLVDVSSFEGEDNRQTNVELQARARELEIEGRSKMTADELRAAIAQREAEKGDAHASS